MADELGALLQMVLLVLVAMLVVMVVVVVATKRLLGLMSLLRTANMLERVAMSVVVVLVLVAVSKNSLGLSLLTANTVPLSAVLPAMQMTVVDSGHDDDDGEEENGE